MTAQEYAFAVIAAVGAISAIAVVTARNVVHAALYFPITLWGNYYWATAHFSLSGVRSDGARERPTGPVMSNE